MTRFSCVLVAAVALVGVHAQAPASAQGFVKAVAIPGKAAVLVCVRDLKSLQCGQYQDRILRAEVQHMNRATNAAAVRAVGRRQLDALIASVG